MQLVKIISVGLPMALGVVMIGHGGVTFAGPPIVRENFARWGYPAGFHLISGVLEVAVGLLLLIPATSRVGAIGSAMIVLASGVNKRCQEPLLRFLGLFTILK